MCLSLGVQCKSNNFDTKSSSPAYMQLLDHVEKYFAVGDSHDDTARKTMTTSQPPIYLQQPGHSLTIVGLERHQSGERNLFVFDPSFGPPADVVKMADGKRTRSIMDEREANKLLKIYRRSVSQLKRHDNFEILS